MPDGTSTIPDKTPIVETERFRSVLRLLKLAFPGAQNSSVTVADLGCYEGGYSLELARQGYAVTGIEARQINFDRCLFLQNEWRLKNLSFVMDDVRNLENYPAFDAVYASGLLYHMADPVRFLRLLAQRTRKLLLLNTHYSRTDIPNRFRHKLSELTTHEGYRGRWYEEWDEDADPHSEKLARNAVDNRRSFWLQKADLLQAMKEAGFDLVFEQYDCHYNIVDGARAIRRNSRGMFVGIKVD